jgi:hypothetical protein
MAKLLLRLLTFSGVHRNDFNMQNIHTILIITKYNI